MKKTLTIIFGCCLMLSASAQLTNRTSTLVLTNAQTFTLTLDANDLATIESVRGTNYNLNYSIAVAMRQQANAIRRHAIVAAQLVRYQAWLKTQTNSP